MTSCYERPTVLLADDHEGILARVMGILADDYLVLATVNDGQRAVQAALDLNPDIIILDIAMPVLNGLEAARQIRRMGVRAKLIFLSIQDDEEYIDEALAMGASYVLKPRMSVDLPEAMRQALAGQMFTSQLWPTTSTSF